MWAASHQLLPAVQELLLAFKDEQFLCETEVALSAATLVLAALFHYAPLDVWALSAVYTVPEIRG